MHVLATAGHVDHGKSTLVLALTRMDPDRFAEEKARGMTIDLGFAWTTLPSGRELALVDVPGHVRFIKNMLAGVGAVDACLFVVDAAEGWKPQSEEHLRILALLGVDHGVIALTKVDLVDEEWAELARLEVADRVTATFLEGVEVVAVDGVSGRGLDELRSALDRLLEVTPTAADRGRPRLWVDRSFAAKGSGTVVTGTLGGGTLSVDDELLLVPGHRTGRAQRVRVRALQSHRHPYPRVGPGHRVAVNLGGVSHDRVARGDALVRPGQWHTTRTLDCSLTVLFSLEHEVSRRGAYHAYIGSGEHPVRLRLLGSDALAPGEAGAARVHLPVALPLLPGDRYVLRESGRGETVGGGEVLDVDPVLPASKAAPDRSAERVVAERGWVEVEVLERLTGERRAPTVGAKWIVSPDVLAATRQELVEAVAAGGRLGLDVAALDDRQRAVLGTMPEVKVSTGRALAAGAAPSAAGGEAPHPFVAALEASPFAPPDPDAAGVDRGELRDLVRRGLVVERDGCYFAPAAVDAAARTVARMLAAHPEGVTVAQVREELGTTRKYLLPLLGHLDATGVTRRRGDLRVAGARLPAL